MIEQLTVFIPGDERCEWKYQPSLHPSMLKAKLLHNLKLSVVNKVCISRSESVTLHRLHRLHRIVYIYPSMFYYVITKAFEQEPKRFGGRCSSSIKKIWKGGGIDPTNGMD
jgi:hypothetical protein